MKCYCLKYDLERQSPKTVFVSKNSSFQIGIRVKRGETYPNCELYRDGSAVEATGTLGSYTTWSLTSGEDENEESLVVKCMGTDLPLKIVTTHSDVAELPAEAGGDKPDLSNYYTKKQVDEKVDALDEFIASVNTTATDAKTEADSASSDATEAKTTAENASATANEAKTAAEGVKAAVETAQSTANAAKSTAETAQTTADSAKTAAEGAGETANAAKTTAESAKTTADGLGTRVTALENAGYQTSSQVDSKVSDALASYSTTDQMDSAISAATSPLAKASDLASYWNKSTETETHAMTGTYEDGTEFSYTVICQKA